MSPTCLPRFPLEQRAQGGLYIFYKEFMAKIIYTKPFLSYQAQIELLQSRGMLFADKTKASHLLKYISYYRFSGYWYPLLENKQNHVFKPNADFETAFSLYKFDRELRKLITAELEKIEVAIRSQMAYSLSIQHGSFWLENENLFINPVKHQSTIAKIKEEMERSDEDFIISFNEKYSNSLPPSFITLEITSFGALSRLYENLQAGKTKREISQSFGLTDKLFASWLHSFVYIRNMCAHHARVWNRFLQVQPLFPRRIANVWISTENISNRRVYYILSMILYFLNTINPHHTFKQKLNNLFEKYPNVDKRAMGFPDNWKQEPLWN